MNTNKFTFFILAMFFLTVRLRGQGTFENLNFESATISPSTPVSSMVATSEAFPDWTAYYYSPTFGTETTSQVYYDGISTGGPIISLMDDNAGFGFGSLQGKYSAFLFGGAGFSSSIAQSGTISAGEESILFDAYLPLGASVAPIVAINGQIINLVQLQTFANYAEYGGNIPTGDVGSTVTLSFTEPPPPTGGPSEFELDNISFSPVAVPEPVPEFLTGIGGLLFAVHRRFRKR